MLNYKNQRFISVDPGKDHFAWAWFNFTRFEEAGVVRFKDHLGLLQSLDSLMRNTGNPDRLVIEKMKVYPGIRAEDPNDLIDVSLTAGVIRGRFPLVVDVEAFRWKGQAPKEVTRGRVIQILKGDPCASMRKTDAGHAYDAIAIGLWARGEYR